MYVFQLSAQWLKSNVLYLVGNINKIPLFLFSDLLMALVGVMGLPGLYIPGPSLNYLWIGFYSFIFYPTLWYIWPWIVNVVESPCKTISLSTPNDVIWKQQLYFLIFFKKCRDSLLLSKIKDFRGSSGSPSDRSVTLLPEQHIPSVSSFQFSASLFPHFLSICHTRTNP